VSLTNGLRTGKMSDDSGLGVELEAVDAGSEFVAEPLFEYGMAKLS